MNASEVVASMRITTTTQKNAMNPGGLVEPGSPTQSFKDDNTNTHHTHHKSSTNVNSTPKKQQQQQPQQHGIHDLYKLEQQVRVKVVFNTTIGHVYLVGDAKKLAKKVYPIRNILRHYHWRLSGQESWKSRDLRTRIYLREGIPNITTIYLQYTNTSVREGYNIDISTQRPK